MKISKAFKYSDGTPGRYLKCGTCKKLGGSNTCCPQFRCTFCNRVRPKQFRAEIPPSDYWRLGESLGISNIVQRSMTPDISSCCTACALSKIIMSLEVAIKYDDMLRSAMVVEATLESNSDLDTAITVGVIVSAVVLLFTVSSDSVLLPIFNGVCLFICGWRGLRFLRLRKTVKAYKDRRTGIPSDAVAAAMTTEENFKDTKYRYVQRVIHLLKQVNPTDSLMLRTVDIDVVRTLQIRSADTDRFNNNTDGVPRDREQYTVWIDKWMRHSIGLPASR